MNRMLLLFAFVMTPATQAQAQGPDWAWAKNTLASNQTILPVPGDITTDKDGNVYTIGGNDDTYICKYSPAGDTLWTKSSGYPYPDYGTGIVTDGTGNLYICGAYNAQGTATGNFFGYPLPQGRQDDIYLAKMDKQGNIQWVKTGGSQWNDRFSFGGITTDVAGNIILSGTVADTAIFDNITVSATYEDPFVARYDNNGNIQWVKTFGGKQTDGGFSAVCDAQGNIYTTGFFKDTAQFGAYTLTGKTLAPTSSAMYLVKLNGNGDVLWAKQFDTADAATTGFNLAISSQGDVFLTGTYYGYISAGNYSFANYGNGPNPYIIKYAPDGSVLFADTIAARCDYQSDITIGFHDDVYLSCDGMAMAKYNANGQRQWRQDMRGDAFCLTTGTYGHVYVTGRVWPNSMLNTTPLQQGLFLAKLNPFPLAALTPEKAEKITLHPNPASSIIQVLCPVAVSYYITDINGARITGGRLAPGKHTINTASYRPGMYTLHTVENNGGYIFIIQ